MDDDPCIAAEVTKGPDVMVADEVVYFDAFVGQAAERTEELFKCSFRAWEMPVALTVNPLMPFKKVFVPKVEHITEEKNLFGILRHPIKERNEALLVRFRVGDDARTEVCIAQEVSHKAED